MTRLKSDRYYTNPQLAKAIVDRAESRGLVRGTVIEPSCGTGAFLRELDRPAVDRVIGVDIEITDEARAWTKTPEKGPPQMRSLMECDWLTLPLGLVYGADCILANPPFDGAEEHVRKALRVIKPSGAVVMLLRSSLLAAGERVIPGWHESHVSPLWQEHPPTWIDFVAPRPSFTGGGSDTAEYVVVTWQPAAIAAGWGAPRVSWLVWRTEKLRNGRRGSIAPSVATEAAAVEDSGVLTGANL